MINPMDLSGCFVLVTGASSGIGRDTAVLLSELGARIVITGRHADRLDHTLSQLAGTGHSVEPFDLNSVEQIPGWVKAVAAKAGPFNGMAHCAGLHYQGPLKVLDPLRFERLQRINVTASMMLAKGLRQRGCCAPGASLVFLSSVTGLVGQPGIAAYAAGKAALLGLARCLALELAGEQIRVNCIAPAMVKTEMAEEFFRSLSPEQVGAIERAHPLGIGRPRDVANAVAFLLSDAARWITGSVLVVDGGFTAQ
jgi:NAD(P)-dependent dehydrogenase (short-subunit alcohol dehydrogenase family)